MDQVAQHRLFFHDARIVLHIRHARDAGGELRNVWGPAHCLEFAAPVQVFRERNEIKGLLLFAKADHPFVNSPVLIEEKIVAAQLFNRCVERVVVEQDRAEDAALGFNVMRKRTFDLGVSRHLFRFIFAYCVSGGKIFFELAKARRRIRVCRLDSPKILTRAGESLKSTEAVNFTEGVKKPKSKGKGAASLRPSV